MRERLYNLIVDKENELYRDKPNMEQSKRIEAIADHLIDNGAIVLPYKEGETI